MPIRIITAEQVRQLLPMDECITAMRSAMRAASAGSIAVPPRLITPLIDGSGALGVMPGSPAELGVYGAKIISLHADNPGRGLPAIQGFVSLFDHTTGTPLAIIEGAEITGIRTAAASGLATDLLAREDAASCGLFGTGVQAVTHIDAMLAVRPVSEFLVWGREASKATRFADEQSQRTGVSVRAVATPEEAGACDIVCTLTGSPTPVLQGAWVRPGAHVNLVGSHSLATREADTALISGAGLYVDLLASCFNEGGDFMIPVEEGAITRDAILGEIGQLLEGTIPGRKDSAQVTVYNSLGMTAQDLFAAHYLFQKAEVADIGTIVDL